MKYAPNETYLQSERVLDVASDLGLNAEPILGQRTDRPLAVLLPSLVDLEAITEPDTEDLDVRIQDFKNELPTAGDKLMPRSFLEVADKLSLAAAGLQSGLVDEFFSVAAPDSVMMEYDDLGPHMDSMFTFYSKASDIPLYKWHLHLTRIGESRVSLEVPKYLGLIDIIDSLCSDVLAGVIESGPHHLEAQLLERAEDFTLEPGDVLAFQSTDHIAMGRVGLRHEFRSTSETRLASTWKPRVSTDIQTVQTKRDSALKQLQIENY